MILDDAIRAAAARGCTYLKLQPCIGPKWQAVADFPDTGRAVGIDADPAGALRKALTVASEKPNDEQDIFG